jgi:predicted amino acid-binding ACT domain protein
LPCPEADSALTERTVRQAFDTELRQGQIQNVDLVSGCSILSVVGDGMAGTPGIAAAVFGALAGAGVNIRAIAQGSSERNISAVIDERQSTRALRAVHARFYLSPHTVSIGLIGPGTVGGVLLEQLASQRERLLRDFHLDLRVRGILTSKRMLLSDTSLTMSDWRATASSGQPADIAAFEEHIHAEHIPHTVILDLLGQLADCDQYPGWLGKGIHIATPNKKANSGALDLYTRVDRGATCRRVALSLRSDRRRRPANHRHAAGPARDRAMRSSASRASSRGRSPTCSTSGTARSRFRRSCAMQRPRGLRAGSARRPVGHGRCAKARSSLPGNGTCSSSSADVALEGLIPRSWRRALPRSS